MGKTGGGKLNLNKRVQLIYLTIFKVRVQGDRGVKRIDEDAGSIINWSAVDINMEKVTSNWGILTAAGVDKFKE